MVLYKQKKSETKTILLLKYKMHAYNFQVEFVEFMAPNGDAAYATFKPQEGENKEAPIRIGEGYPIEDPEGWSSPAFVVKSVKKKGVPYKVSDLVWS